MGLYRLLVPLFQVMSGHLKNPLQGQKFGAALGSSQPSTGYFIPLKDVDPSLFPDFRIPYLGEEGARGNPKVSAEGAAFSLFFGIFVRKPKGFCRRNCFFPLFGGFLWGNLMVSAEWVAFSLFFGDFSDAGDGVTAPLLLRCLPEGDISQVL